MDRFTTSELLKSFLTQRIDAVLASRPSCPENETEQRAESVLESLPKDQNACIRAFLNLIAGREADEKQLLYLRGIQDGIALAGLVQAEQDRAKQKSELFLRDITK